MTREGDDYVLSSGRRFYVHGTVIGLSEDLELHQGSDGGTYPHFDGESHSPDNQFTEDERLEISMMMIARWAQWGSR